MIQTEKRLGKNLGFFAVYAIGTGTMIGAGIFVLPGIAISEAGPAAALSFLLGGLITLATMFSVIELATGMPQAGGSYFFISRALGPMFGTVVGIGAWLSLVFKGSFALIGLAEYFRVFFPLPVLLVAVVSGLLLLWINLRGSKSSGSLQNVIVGGLIGILVLFVIRGLMLGEPAQLQPFMPYGASSVLRTTGLIFISYLGVTQLAAISEEVKDPAKNIPRAFLLSVLTVIVIYVGVILAVNGVVSLDKLQMTNTPLVTAAQAMQGSLGVIVITIAGFLATVSTANAAIMSSSRFPFAMARDHLMPAPLVSIHDVYETPYRAILLTGGIMLTLLFLFNVEVLAKLGSTLNVMIFVLVNTAVIIFRKNRIPGYKPTFKDPFFPVTQIIGIGGSLALLPSLGMMSLLFALAVILAGVAWYALVGRNKTTYTYGMQCILDETPVVAHAREKEKRILVPLGNPAHERDLLDLADALGDGVTAINVVKVPGQTDLHAAMEQYEEEKSRTCSLLEKAFEEWVGDGKNNRNYLVAFDHSVSNAVVEQAQLEGTDLIVMGWRRSGRFHSTVGSITYEILAKAKCHLAVLKGRIPENLNRITVAYDGGNNARYGLHLAKKLALKKSADVWLLHVISPDATEEKKRAMKEEMAGLCQEETAVSMHYELVERFSPLDAILEADRHSGLTVVGDSSKRFRNTFLSTIPQQVARHSLNPVLIIKRFEAKRRWLRFFE